MILLNDLKRQHQIIGDDIRQAINNVCDSGWYSLGREVTNFENVFANFCGVDHCIGLNSGTDALEMSLRALDIGQGAVVATTANAGGYASTAILSVGATPYYIDVNPSNFNMCAQALNTVINQVQAVIVTHLYGRLAPMADLLSITCPLNIPIIEDAAHAHGALQNKQRAGSFGDLACFSFYPTKNLGAYGDAGAIVTNNNTLANRCRQFAQYGWSDRYNAELTGGRNSRLDEIQAAILSVKLVHLDAWNKRRRQIAQLYETGLQTVPRISFQSRGSSNDSVHLFVIECEDRSTVQKLLKKAGVASAAHYPIADHHQRAFQSLYKSEPLKITERLCTRVLSLPCYPEMQDSEVLHVISAIQKHLSND